MLKVIGVCINRVVLLPHVSFKRHNSLLKCLIPVNIDQFVLKKIYSYALELMRKKAVANMEDGDVALDQLKSKLETEFEVVHKKLDKILDSPLKLAHINMSKALVELHFQDIAQSRRYFEKCEDNCEEAFTKAQSFAKKAAATRMKVMCILYLNNYFFGDYNKEKVQMHCKKSIQRLLLEPEVRSAMRDQFEDSMFAFASKTQREIVFDELASLIYFVKSRVNIDTKVLLNCGKSIEVKDFPNRVWSAHDNKILSILAVGNFLFSTCSDNKLRKWDLTTLKATFFPVHEHPIECLAILGNRLYAGTSNAIKVWDITTKDLVASLACHKVSCMVIWQNKLFHNEYNSDIKVWDLTTSLELHPLEGHTRWITCMVISGHRLYSGSFDNTIRVWDLTTMTQIAVLDDFYGRINCLAVSDGKLYSWSWESTIRVWDLLTNFELESYPCEHIISRMIISEKLIHWMSSDGAVGVLNMETKQNTVLKDKSCEITAFALSGEKLITAGKDGITCTYL